MLVRCRFNTGADLPPHEYGLFYSPQTKFTRLDVGREYRVHAVLVYQRGILVLVPDRDGRPGAWMVELFEVVDGSLPSHWEFATRDDGEYGYQAVFGYPHLVADKNHMNDLVEMEPAALRLFAEEAARES
ncbi:hypothetical protein [Actinokineospora pegani]|uniref:hypothetical protein n=1 Tax=Actinokineospora pegani TaxID=2654637 RepID=UPI0012E9B564|nr:hypothetical protein [Actinokineospora pegani]